MSVAAPCRFRPPRRRRSDLGRSDICPIDLEETIPNMARDDRSQRSVRSPKRRPSSRISRRPGSSQGARGGREADWKQPASHYLGKPALRHARVLPHLHRARQLEAQQGSHCRRPTVTRTQGRDREASTTKVVCPELGDQSQSTHRKVPCQNTSHSEGRNLNPMCDLGRLVESLL
jgi:hypothetical protein